MVRMHQRKNAFGNADSENHALAFKPADRARLQIGNEGALPSDKRGRVGKIFRDAGDNLPRFLFTKIYRKAKQPVRVRHFSAVRIVPIVISTFLNSSIEIMV